MFIIRTIDLSTEESAQEKNYLRSASLAPLQEDHRPFARSSQDQFLFISGISYPIPIGSMYGIYANIGGILMVNVSIYGIHGSYGLWLYIPLNPHNLGKL